MDKDSIFNKDLVDEVFKTNLIENRKGYKILINGKTFITSSGRTTWMEPSHAKGVLTQLLWSSVSNEVRKTMREIDPNIDVSKEYFYINAWKIFMDYLKDNDIIQIIKVE